MRIRWFGQPWPSADLRAPICDNDDYEVPPPLGEKCIVCNQPVVEGERGILMGASPDLEGSFLQLLQLREGDYAQTYEEGVEMYLNVCAAHIDCHVSTIIPNHVATVERIPKGDSDA